MNLFRWINSTGPDLQVADSGMAAQTPEPVAPAAKDTPRRFIVRQGDVMLRQVTPDVHTKLQEVWENGLAKIVERDNGRVVLAYGEVTGHSHALHSPKVTMFAADGRLSGRYLKVDETADLVHEEHDTISVPPGVYEVVRQREYDDSEELRRAGQMTSAGPSARYVAD